MRRIIFALTRDQLLDGSKTVTRRKGWKNLKPGDRLLAVSKRMGLKPGESAEVYGPIEVLSVRREELSAIENQGQAEASREGFGWTDAPGFIDFFCQHMGGDAYQLVTRIEFRRVEPRALDGVKLSPAMRAVVLEIDARRRVSFGEMMAGGKARTIDALWKRDVITAAPRGSRTFELTRLGRQVAAELREGGQR